jgi:hypothetical protein
VNLSYCERKSNAGRTYGLWVKHNVSNI